MGGSAQYRFSKKIRNAIANGASEEEIAELERQQQEAIAREKANRQRRLAMAGLAELANSVSQGSGDGILHDRENTISRESVTSKFESLDDERGLRFPRINTDLLISARPSYPITDRQLGYRERLSNNQRLTLDAMERRLQTDRYTHSEFKDEMVDIAKALGMKTSGMSARTLAIGINDLLGSRL